MSIKPFHKNTLPSTIGNAKELRQKETFAEEILWDELKNRKLKGYKFRRQHPIDTFVLDFYCHEVKLCTELDGSVHRNNVAETYDAWRSKWLSNYGITIIRFENKAVFGNMTLVLIEITKRIEILLV